ncbi:EscS/YscS/HrcS family type III secretion system export apparatus protein [Paraburkholderia hayleyella]|uniref:EscS/YscS/HrcS family type III secretion system export apparatus protein n=1 Tax=Paraburkholderia hayleyella TaxID=2152889 RepID=UPI0012915800|nr:flagellar biosynthetic protein FliQ [Paraburkholderia hayleyella]
MNEFIAFAASTFLLVFWLSLPVLGTAALVGVVVGIVQSVTQIQDQSIAYGIKFLAVGAVLLFTATWMHAELTRVLDRALALITSGHHL